MDNAFMSTIPAPVLLIFFTRSDLLEQTLKPLAHTKPRKLYMAVDGPRDETDKPKIADCKKLALDFCLEHGFSWELLESEKNLGCRKRITSAISECFTKEERLIILEEDCVAHPSFFRFCDDLLDYYADDEEVMSISGNNFQAGQRRGKSSYFFSDYFHCWGWATWARAWKHCDMGLKEWPQTRDNSWWKKRFRDRNVRWYWTQLLDRVYAGEGQMWSTHWLFSIWMLNGLNVAPQVNLVKNIGFDERSTHSSNPLPGAGNYEEAGMAFPLRHPRIKRIHHKADAFEFYYHFCPSLKKKPFVKAWLSKHPRVRHLLTRIGVCSA